MRGSPIMRQTRKPIMDKPLTVISSTRSQQHPITSAAQRVIPNHPLCGGHQAPSLNPFACAEDMRHPMKTNPI
ncbi:MAG: hypothetical protein AAGA75_12860 [Cyanobacteria bacterium P01_E01_bin.6]